MEEGIYFGLPFSDYLAAPGLSHSGALDLLRSPLSYWHKHVRPDRKPEAPSKAQRLGTAIHARLLEPASFPQRYARALTEGALKSAHAGRVILDTVKDMEAWLKARGIKCKSGDRKPDLIARVLAAIDGSPLPPAEQPVVWEIAEAEHVRDVQGKELLTPAEYARVEGAALAVAAQPAAQKLLYRGRSEVSFFVRDPRTGILLKSRMDCVTPHHTVDLKSFSLGEGNRTVPEHLSAELYFRGYYSQAVWYSDVRELARLALLNRGLRVHVLKGHDDVGEGWLDDFLNWPSHGFCFLFVESEAPYHLDARRLERPEPGGASPEEYWNVARARHAEALRLFDENASRHGLQAWREPLRVEPLGDEDLPWLMREMDHLPYQPAFEQMEASEL